MELIQYAPQTETVHEVPLLLSPPWINKYYIMDLAPGRSFVEWAVAHGHTVFAISYRNPDASMRDVGLDDYLLRGPYDALDVIADITGAERSTWSGCASAARSPPCCWPTWPADGRRSRVRSATLLNTLVDFSEPGPMGQLPRPGVGRAAERARCSSAGSWRRRRCRRMFDLLRARDLIWNYVESGWLMGEPPPAFDILAWNADGTRMPADMHSFYLRCCYVENQLARGEMTLAGTRLDLATVTADAYVLSAREDHIAPWKSAYATTELLGGEVRFVLTLVGPHGRHRQPADPSAAGTGPTRRPAASAAGRRPRLAGGRHRAPRLVVGGLGGLDRDAGRRPPPAARHGQRRPPAVRRRPRHVRPRDLGRVARGREAAGGRRRCGGPAPSRRPVRPYGLGGGVVGGGGFGDDGEDLVAVELELGGADAGEGPQGHQAGGAGDGDAPQVLVAEDDVGRDAVGPGPLRPPGAEGGLGGLGVGGERGEDGGFPGNAAARRRWSPPG